MGFTDEGLANSRFWSQSFVTTGEASKGCGKSSHVPLPMRSLVFLHKAHIAPGTLTALWAPAPECSAEVMYVLTGISGYCAIIPEPEHLQYLEKQLNIDFEIKKIPVSTRYQRLRHWLTLSSAQTQGHGSEITCHVTGAK